MEKLKGAILSDRGVVRVGGAEAETFLQGLITADVAGLAEGEARLAALLTPQGKILFDFLILREGDGFLIDARAEAISELIKRLSFYKLRAKVDIADESGARAVIALWGGDQGDEDFFADPRHGALGRRAIVAREEAERRLTEAGAEMVPLAAYHAHRIGLCVSEGGLDFVLGETFPHEADMDRLGGISFSKGCFVGQEVVSRMEHRGTTRSRIVAVTIDGASEPGAEIRAAGKPVGRLGSVEDGRGLALMRLDRVEAAEAAGEAIMAGEAVVSVLKPVADSAATDEAS